MSDYKETSVTGTAWQRCKQVLIDNPYNGTPTVRMSEEKIVNLDGAVFQQTAEGLSFTYDPAETFPLLDPVTGAPTGVTMSGGELYVALFSLYMAKAQARDQAQV